MVCSSAKAIKESPSKLSYVYQCVGCDTFHLQPVGRVATRQGSTRYLPGTGPVISPDCKQCGKHHNMGGPIWSAPIHDPEWVASMLANVTAMKSRYPAFDKVHSILTAVSEVSLIFDSQLISHRLQMLPCMLDNIPPPSMGSQDLRVLLLRDMHMCSVHFLLTFHIHTVGSITISFNL